MLFSVVTYFLEMLQIHKVDSVIFASISNWNSALLLKTFAKQLKDFGLREEVKSSMAHYGTTVRRGGNQPMGGQQRSVYGEENEQMEEELKHKVSALKTLTIDIGEEVRYQNRELQGMDDDMDKVGGFLSSTMGRLKGISRHGYGKMYCYLFLFVMAVFFVMYWMIRLK